MGDLRLLDKIMEAFILRHYHFRERLVNEDKHENEKQDNAKRTKKSGEMQQSRTNIHTNGRLGVQTTQKAAMALETLRKNDLAVEEASSRSESNKESTRLRSQAAMEPTRSNKGGVGASSGFEHSPAPVSLEARHRAEIYLSVI